MKELSFEQMVAVEGGWCLDPKYMEAYMLFECEKAGNGSWYWYDWRICANGETP